MLSHDKVRITICCAAWKRLSVIEGLICSDHASPCPTSCPTVHDAGWLCAVTDLIKAEKRIFFQADNNAGAIVDEDLNSYIGCASRRRLMNRDLTHLFTHNLQAMFEGKLPCGIAVRLDFLKGFSCVIFDALVVITEWSKEELCSHLNSIIPDNDDDDDDGDDGTYHYWVVEATHREAQWVMDSINGDKSLKVPEGEKGGAACNTFKIFTEAEAVANDDIVNVHTEVADNNKTLYSVETENVLAGGAQSVPKSTAYKRRV